MTCKCTVVCYGDVKATHEIDYCALNAAAEQMRDALTKLIQMRDETGITQEEAYSALFDSFGQRFWAEARYALKKATEK